MSEEKIVKEIYTDGIGKIHFFGGAIRMDLFSFLPAESEDQKPTPVTTKRIVMSPNAFLASYESFVNMIAKLQEAGIIAKNTTSEDSAEAEQDVSPEVAPNETESDK